MLLLLLLVVVVVVVVVVVIVVYIYIYIYIYIVNDLGDLGSYETGTAKRSDRRKTTQTITHKLLKTM